jgi:hypothetical protein
MPPETANANRDCREEFKSTAMAYRQRSRAFSIFAWVGLAFWLLWFVPTMREIGVAGFLVCWTIGFFGSFILLKKICPACQKDIDQCAGRFCPECGAHAIKKRGFWAIGFPQCEACEKKLVRGRGGRRYKLRFCRNCGAHVDDDGL